MPRRIPRSALLKGGATSNATNHKNRTRADSDGLLEFELVFLGPGVGRRDFLKRTTAPRTGPLIATRLRWPKENDMSSPASLKNHPIHPMLVALPIGLWIFALICDVVFATGGAAIWNTVALYCVAAGIVGALLAAIPGFIDYLSIDEAAMKRIGTYHLLLNLGAVVLFGINLWLRFRLPENSRIPLLLSI